MTERQPTSPRHRLQELLAIPERLRTDAQWDEINELEIELSRVNRTDAPAPGVRRDAVAPPNRPKPDGGAPSKRPPRKFHKRPPKGKTP